MSTQITKIDPKEFGLETKQVETIEQAFAPKIKERDGLVEIYGQIIKKELTQSTCDEAGELRRKLVKVRTGIADIHKTQKAFFLAAGRFVDAWKNKETAPIEQMEESMSKIEKHFVIIEQERIAKLESDRTEMLSKYSEVIPMSLGLMDKAVFDAFLQSQKVAYEARIEVEKQAELNRIAAEKAEAAERERIRIENERLKAEAAKREKEIQEERIAAEKKQRELEAQIKAKADAEAKAIADAKAEAARIETARIEAQKAPDKDKLIAFVNSIVLPEMPALKTESATTTMNVITAKFEAFKAWANSQITTI